MYFVHVLLGPHGEEGDLCELVLSFLWVPVIRLRLAGLSADVYLLSHLAIPSSVFKIYFIWEVGR